MNGSISRLLAESSNSVTLWRADFAAPIDALEDAEDQIAVLEHQLAMAKGSAPRPLTMDKAERVNAAESPVKVSREKAGLTQRNLAEIETRAKAERGDAATTGPARSRSISMRLCLSGRATGMSANGRLDAASMLEVQAQCCTRLMRTRQQLASG